eukprot:TRINITY_DN3387_c0_g1_i1.p1 TRINITY_DN3387_c0_g1~~TRINITY_DN3387_c0_g1_i1.p1  ORF type:complete len:740 (+),score=171.75 TRINITY_DN3387_c0_g1_i1:299-2518(+)
MSGTGPSPGVGGGGGGGGVSGGRVVNPSYSIEMEGVAADFDEKTDGGSDGEGGADHSTIDIDIDGWTGGDGGDGLVELADLTHDVMHGRIAPGDGQSGGYDYDDDDDDGDENEDESHALISSGGSTRRRIDGSDDAADKKPKSKLLFDSEEDKPKISSLTSSNLWRVVAIARPELPIIACATVALAIAAGSALVMPTMAGRIIDAIALHHSYKEGGHDLNVAVVTLFVFFAVGAVFTFIRVALFNIAGERIVKRLRNELFQRIVRQEVGFFDSNRTGELINRLSSDTQVIETSLTNNLSMAMRYSATSLLSVIILFFVSWKLTLVMLLVIPPVSVGAVLYGQYVRSIVKKTQEALAKATEVSEECVSNIRTVRAFAMESFESGKYAKEVEVSYVLGVKLSLARGGFAGGVAMAMNVAIMIVLWYGGVLVLRGTMSPGTLASFLLYAISTGFSLAALSSLYGDLMKAVGASERVFELTDREPLVRFDQGIVPKSLVGRVDFEEVHFRYPSREEIEVLKGVTFSLSPGKVVAVVGESGGGKTTCAHLIEGFYYATEGRVLIDNIDIRELDAQYLRRHIGIVSQEPCLFSGTIAENIAYGLPDTPLDRIREVAQQANASDFIEKMTDGYDTQVGERGVRLSGGQKQRITIARALLKDPKILLLDEATSSLDSESEYLVQNALDKLMVGRSVLVIAHRLSTVRNADVVLVVESGRIIERGVHSQLIGDEGSMYRQLVQRQLEA